MNIDKLVLKTRVISKQSMLRKCLGENVVLMISHSSDEQVKVPFAVVFVRVNRLCVRDSIEAIHLTLAPRSE